MSVALFSTAYLPPVAYVAALMRYDEVLVEHKETYPKQTYRNRAVILTAGGTRSLAVPVVRHNHSRTDEVTIDYRSRWNTVHRRTLAAAYAASPYWLYLHDELDTLLDTRYDRLVDLNQAVTGWLLRKLKVPCRLSPTTGYQPGGTAPDDCRNRFSPKVPLPAEGFPPYCQVFADRHPFVHNLSALDLLMNLGPDATGYLKTVRL